MQWPQRVQEIVDELARRHIDLVRGDDDARRRLTRMFAEQCRHELGPNWGTKRADPGRPLSADVVCTRDPFVGWDTQIGGIDPLASDDEVLRRHIARFPESIDLAGQTFVPVDPVNHLGVNGTPAPGPTPIPFPGPPDGGEAVERFLDGLDAFVEGMGALADHTRMQAAATERLNDDGLRDLAAAVREHAAAVRELAKTGVRFRF